MSYDPINLLIAIGTIIAAISAAAAATYAAIQVKSSTNQLNHSRINNLTQLSNQQNWNQLDHFKKLPPFLPSWVGLTEREYAWRVLFFNHLNILKEVYIDYKHKIIKKDEVADWERLGRYWFQNFQEENNNEVISEGRNILRQVLQPEEGYSKEFRSWLVASRIIPSALILDL
jgi:hypothetical protein